MAVFGGMTLTNKGLVLQGKAQAGGKLNYTRIAVGDGSLTGQAVPAMNGLISQKISLPIKRITTQPPNKAIIGSVLRNADVSTGFYWREVGVFAQDPDAGEILYAYANAGVTADYIPPGGGSDIIEKTFDCVVVVGTAANITAVIDESLVFAKKSELDAVDAVKVDKVSGKGLSANDYTTAEKTKLAGITAGAGGAGSATDTVIGSRTILDTTAPTGDSGTITNLLGWLANTVKSITGKSSWRTAPATTLEAAKAHADDATRHLNAADRAAISGAIPSSQRNVANGVAALDNASLIVGQGVRLGGSEQYIEKVFSFQTVNGTANQKIDYSFGPAVMSGFIEVTVTGAWGNASSEGRLTKRMDVMGSTAGTINRQSTQYTEVSGAIRGQLSISDVYWKDGKWIVTVEARTSAGNNYTTHVKHHGPLGAKDWVQGSVYTGAATTLPLAMQVIPDDTKTKSGQQVETTVGAQAKADAAQAAAIAYTDTKVGRVDLTQTLGPGTSVVMADANGSELDLVVQGVTRSNLIGKLGSGESLDGWSVSGSGSVTLSTNQKRSGSSSVKFSASSASSSYLFKDFPFSLDTTKYYILAAWIFVESTSGSNSPEISLRDAGAWTTRYSTYGSVSTLGTWQFKYVKIPASNSLVGTGFRLLFGLGAASAGVSYIDELRLYEVSAAEYTAIGTTITGDAVDAYWPYVDGKQHVQGVAVTKKGKNLLSGAPNTLHANARMNGPYDMTLTASAADQVSDISAKMNVKGGETYTFSASITASSGEGRVQISEYATDGSPIKTPSTMIVTAFTWTTDINTSYILVRTRNTAAGTITYKNWQLEFGSAVTPFTPAESQSIILPVTLGQIGDVRDSVFSAGNDWMYVERVRKNVILDGTGTWGRFGNTENGFTSIYAALPSGANAVADRERVINYKGELLSHAYPPTSGGQSWLPSSVGSNVYITVSNVDSGWVNGISPNGNAIKGLTNGWKATTSSGGVYTAWVSILDGSAPATNTEAWVAANKAPGWIAWASLDYMLALASQPVPVPNAEGSITLHPGGNQINVETGVIQREKVVPKLDSGSYYIISQSSGSYWGKAVMSCPTQKFLAVFKDAENDTQNWVFAPDGLGALNARTLPGSFDSTADYYVTYIVRDKYALTANVTEAAATWRTGLGGVVCEVVQSVAELRQDNARQDFADDYIEGKVDNLKLGVADGTVLPDTIQKYQLTGNSGLGKGGNPTVSPNTLLDTGIYTLTFSSPDLPVTGSTTSVFVKRYNSAYIIQEADVFATINTITIIRKFTRESRNSGSSWSSWRELKMKASPLPNNMDLNTLVSEGQFYAVSNASSATITNQPPVGGSYCFNLDIKTTVSADGTGCNQTVTYYSMAASAPVIFTRNYYQSAWTTWQQIETTAAKNVAGGYAGLDSSSNVSVDNLPFGSVTNMLGDSGRFAGTNSDPSEVSCSNTFANIRFFSSWNGTTVTGAGKFYHDNSTNGGVSGALTADVSSLLLAMYGGTTVRYGTEFHIATYTMGSGTQNPSGVVPGAYLMTVNASFPAAGVGKNFTVSFWIRVKSGTKVAINKESRLKKNGIAQSTHLQVTPSDGWMHVETLISGGTGYSNGAPSIYATPGDVVQIALPVVVAGGIGVGVHTSPVMGATLGFVPLPANSYTASDVLSKLITVDGAGSGLDADLHAGKTLAEVVQGSLSYLGTIAGSSPNFTGTATPPIAALAPGQRLSFKALTSTSGPITLNVNGLGAKSIKKPNGNNPPLVQGGVYTVVYDGTAFILQGEGGEYGTAGAADVLAGKTFGTENGLVNGEIPLRGGENYPGWREATVEIPSGVGRIHLAIPKGAYLTGTSDQGGLVGVYKDDPGFNPAYFRADVNMFGLQGAMPVITDGADPAQGVGKWGDGALAVYPREGYRKGGAGAGEIKVTPAQLQSADPAFIPANIKAGVSIYGITGNFSPTPVAFNHNTGAVAPSSVSGYAIEWIISIAAPAGKTLAAVSTGLSSSSSSYVTSSNVDNFRVHTSASWSYTGGGLSSTIAIGGGTVTSFLQYMNYQSSTGALSFRFTVLAGGLLGGTLQWIGSGVNLTTSYVLV
ncbi:phage tail protein [Paenibacillus sp. FSL H3-0469]|uniref:phage tail-collar fiber domain-containing protein n=1 Tax=Paenibacillus sp. FSL H3-0469 TaxID=2954506 RepID=UPI003101A3EB